MERDSFLAGEQGPGQDSGEGNAPEFQTFEEHMEEIGASEPAAVVEEENGGDGAEKDGGNEKLETMRRNYVNALTLGAVNKMWDVYHMVNRAEMISEGSEEEIDAEDKAVELIEGYWDRRVFGGKTEDGADRTIKGVRQDGTGYEADYYGGFLIDERIVKIAYKAGAALFAGSEEGMKKAAHMDLEYGEGMTVKSKDSKLSGTFVNINYLKSSKQARLVQLGARAMRKALPEAVRKQVQLIRPEI